jgi:hypothetical protein
MKIHPQMDINEWGKKLIKSLKAFKIINLMRKKSIKSISCGFNVSIYEYNKALLRKTLWWVSLWQFFPG